MLKQQELSNIFSSFNSYVKNRKIVAIYDADDKYILSTTCDGMNVDPYYFYNKKNGVIAHSSLMPFLEFNRLLVKARKNIVWEE